MKLTLALILRQIPWEKVAGKVAGLILDRYEAGKIKSLPNDALVTQNENTRKVLEEINSRIKAKK